ncbi:MAG: hypothetical protein ABIP39_12265 [Polyangiaceae bacterium]
MQRRWPVILGVFALLAGAASCGLDLAGMESGDDGGLDATADGLAEAGADSGVDSDIGDAVNDNPFDVPADIGPCFDASLQLCDDDAGCGAGTKCTPFIPPAWQIVSLASPTCAGPYPVPFTAAPIIQYVTPAPTNCSCTGCTITAPGVCSGSATIATGAACGNAAQSVTADGTCKSITSINLVSGDHIKAVQTETPPTCAPPVQTKGIPTFDGGATQVCTSNATGLCDFHSFCAPSTGAPVCIARAGDQACPSGFRIALATGGTDTRDCTACTCGTTAPDCIGTMVLTTNGGCNMNAQVFTYDGGCNVGVAGTGWDHVNIGPGTPSGECRIADGGVVVGSVAPTNPITVCCQN